MVKHMKKQVSLQGKAVEVELSSAAEQALAARTSTLIAEMELYFSCLIRKQVRFHEQTGAADKVAVTDHLALCFRPVMTRACGIDYEGDEPPLTDFPIQRAEAFIPHWLKIDFKNNQWIGEFGF